MHALPEEVLAFVSDYSIRLPFLAKRSLAKHFPKSSFHLTRMDDPVYIFIKSASFIGLRTDELMNL